MKELGIAAIVAVCVGALVLGAYAVVDPQRAVTERGEAVSLTPAPTPVGASPTPADASPTADADGGNGLSGAELGQSLASTNGCLACHSTDGTVLIGPSWQGLAGRQVTLTDGSTVVADEAYLRQSITDPASQIVEGFTNDMPATLTAGLSDEEVDALIAYIQTLE